MRTFVLFALAHATLIAQAATTPALPPIELHGVGSVVTGRGGEQPPRAAGIAPVGVPQDPSAVGYLNLPKRHPDGEEAAKEFNSYSSDLALQRLGQIQTFLGSFRELTRRVRRTIPAADLKAIGNTSGEMQTIGFHNIPLIVEGTLLKQEYQLRQAQYELAQVKRGRGEISAQDLDQARSAYERATKRFQVFWDTKRPGD